MAVTYVEPRNAYDLLEEMNELIRKTGNLKNPAKLQNDYTKLAGQLSWAIDDLTSEITRLQQELADQR
jgi:phosphoglycerate-specific signal transduction histidine kinase